MLIQPEDLASKDRAASGADVTRAAVDSSYIWRTEMRAVIASILGVLLAANGIAMLVGPAGWYAAVPGVTHTGPLNFHFVRDIGCAYLMAGGALVWLAINLRAWPAALTAAVFLTLHAAIHVADAAAGREAVRQLLIELPGVFVPPTIALGLAWSGFSKEKEDAHMANTAATRQIRATI
jgi:hypothetical protein